MKINLLEKIKKNSFAFALLILGFTILFLIKDYKEVPSGIGPAFFPRIVAILMIGLSIISFIIPDNRVVEKVERSATVNIIITVISLILMVVIMKYIHPLLGIFLFLAVYLKIIAKLSAMKTIIITFIGTGVLYAVILALRIPL